MTAEELKKALDDIQRQQEVADRATNQALRLVVGRLRNGNAHLLSQLKIELRNFNITTGQWSTK